MEEEKILEEKYPAVIYGYDVALKSYDWSISRLDSMDGAIDRLLVWISSINIGALAIFASIFETKQFDSYWLFVSMTMFLICIALGIVIKSRGSLKLPVPEYIYNEWLHFTEWQFKKNAIFKAAEDYKKNCQLVNTKGYWGISIMWVFLGNLTTLVIWIIGCLRS